MKKGLAILALLVLVLSACAAPVAPATTDAPAADAATATEAPAEAAAEDEAAATECAELTPVRLQLQWVTQSQFAGYFAAKDQGIYEANCLDVTILEGAVEIVPQQVVASGEAE